MQRQRDLCVERQRGIGTQLILAPEPGTEPLLHACRVLPPFLRSRAAKGIQELGPNGCCLVGIGLIVEVVIGMHDIHPGAAVRGKGKSALEHVADARIVGRDEDEAKNIRRRWGILFQNGALFDSMLSRQAEGRLLSISGWMSSKELPRPAARSGVRLLAASASADRRS